VPAAGALKAHAGCCVAAEKPLLLARKVRDPRFLRHRVPSHGGIADDRARPGVPELPNLTASALHRRRTIVIDVPTERPGVPASCVFAKSSKYVRTWLKPVTPYARQDDRFREAHQALPGSRKFWLPNRAPRTLIHVYACASSFEAGVAEGQRWPLGTTNEGGSMHKFSGISSPLTPGIPRRGARAELGITRRLECC